MRSLTLSVAELQNRQETGKTFIFSNKRSCEEVVQKHVEQHADIYLKKPEGMELTGKIPTDFNGAKDFTDSVL